jgi:hypothetical protein
MDATMSARFRLLRGDVCVAAVSSTDAVYAALRLLAGNNPKERRHYWYRDERPLDGRGPLDIVPADPL